MSPPPITVSDVRRWADRCGANAEDATDAATRDRLLKMQTALLILARNDDWRSANAEGAAAADAELQAALERWSDLRRRPTTTATTGTDRARQSVHAAPAAGFTGKLILQP